MIRVAHTGDLHLTEGPRFTDTKRCLDYIVDDGIDQGAELWLVGGDLAGTTVPHRETIQERLALADVFQRMADHAPVVIIQGNHDYPGDLEIFGRLAAEHPIHVVDRPAIVNLLTRNGHGARVFCLPYPTKRFFLANGNGDGHGIETQNQAVAGGLRGIFAHWRNVAAESDVPCISLAHINVAGARVAGGEILIGREIEAGSADLDELGCDYGALSHIHLHQQMAMRWWYAGSPDRGNFGETDEKGYVIVDVARGAEPVIHRRLTPARRLVTIDVSWSPEDGWKYPAGLPSLEHAEVRIRATIPEEHAAVARSEEAILVDVFADADAVKIDRKIQVAERVRVPAIATAKTTADKVVAYWTSLGSAAPDAATQARCLEKLASLAQRLAA